MKSKRTRRLAVLLIALMLPVFAAGEEAQPEATAVEITETPTEKPTPEPTKEPTPEPTKEPTPEPTAQPTPDPTEQPALTAVEESTAAPANETVSEPTDSSDDVAAEEQQTVEPDASVEASQDPTVEPAASATAQPESHETPAPAQTSSADSTATAQPVKVIADVAALEISEIVLEEKPSYEQALSLLPEEVEVRLADGVIESVPVLWSCAGFDADAEEYSFECALTGETYALAEGVELPGIVLRIERPTQLTSGDFVCRINEDGSLAVIAYTGRDSSVRVPAKIEDHKVTGIAASAFAGSESLREIEVSAGITELDGGAFAGCSHLEKVVLPDSLESVGSGAFDGCDALEWLTLRVSEEIVMDSADGYEREITEEKDGEFHTRKISVSLGKPVTDIVVIGELRVESAIRVGKDHALKVESGARLEIAQGGDIIVLGQLVCAGSAENEGRIVACAGEVSGVDANVLREHSWIGGRCEFCEESQMIALDAEYIGGQCEKTYDGSSALDLSADDFRLVGVLEGDDVYIAAVNIDFSGVNVGEYSASAELVLAGESAQRYSAKPVDVSVTVQQRRVKVTPRDGQHKAYGSKDPVLAASYSGVVAGDALAGALAREKGESAGKYRILAGSVDDLNPNYKIELQETYFEITPKSIAEAGVSVAKIGNQRYTGSAVMPEVSVKDGTRALKEGSDYVLEFSDNISVGTAKVTVRGIGNYAGSRQSSFRIIKVSSGSGGGFPATDFGGSEGAAQQADANQISIDSLNNFGGDDDVPAEEQVPATDRLEINSVDFGELIYDDAGLAAKFIPSERMVEEGDQTLRILSIEAAEATDESGVSIENEYTASSMRLSMEVIAGLNAEGYTHIELIVGEAQARIPLETLYAEYVTADFELRVDHYEVRLKLVQDEADLVQLQRMLEGYAPVTAPVRFEVLAFSSPQGDEVAEGVDVLNLLDGVQLLFAPLETPDYLGKAYYVLGMAAAQTDLISEPVRAQFIMDNDCVKSPVVPMLGGVYALAAAAEQ